MIHVSSQRGAYNIDGAPVQHNGPLAAMFMVTV